MDTKPEQLPDSSAHLSYRPDYEPQTAAPPPFQEKTALTPTQTWATRPARPRLLVLLPAAVVIITTFGFVVVILVILLHFQCVETQGGKGILPAIRKMAFYTVEGHKPSVRSKSHLWIVTISSAASQVASGTSAIVMALVAYRVGAEWLRLSKSQSSQSPAETPSPAQYGMLVRLLGSSSVLAIAEASVYTARTWNRAKLPKIFRHSLWLATVVWLLARLIGLADLWLHTQSTSERSSVKLERDASSPIPQWGVSFNQSICADMMSTYSNSTASSPLGWECLGPYQYFISYVTWGHNIAFDVMTNSTNAAFHVGIVENDTAFVFPGPGVVKMESDNFVIPTFATRATCTSLNRVCAKDPNTALVDCTAAGYPNFPYIRNGTVSAGQVDVVDRILGVVGNDLVGKESGAMESAKTPSNPAKIAVQLQWDTLEQGPAPHPPAAPGAEPDHAVDDLSHPTLYASCDLTFLDAFVEWDNQQWRLLNTTESSQERTATLWLPIVWQYATELIASNLMYTARRNTTAETMFALGKDLARLTLATAAGFYEPSPASEVSETEIYIVSKYPVLPIAALLLLLCAYGLITSVFLLQVYRTPDEAIVVPGSDRELLGGGLLGEETQPSMLSLAQRWLTNPMPLVGHSFAGGDGQDGARSAAYSAINTAYDGNEGHRRLTIGLVGDRFGVTAWGQR